MIWLCSNRIYVHVNPDPNKRENLQTPPPTACATFTRYRWVLRNFSASYRRCRGLAYRLRGEPQERLHNGAGEPAMPLHRAAELSQRTAIQVLAPFDKPLYLC